jgi:hypothetical protein
MVKKIFGQPEKILADLRQSVKSLRFFNIGVYERMPKHNRLAVTVPLQEVCCFGCLAVSY